MRYIIAIVCLLAISCSTKQSEDKAKLNASAVMLTDLNGTAIKLSDLKGKTVFVNFWATWCRPCVHEIPSIAKLEEKLKGKDIVFFFASDEEIDKIIKFKSSKNLSSQFVRVENPESLGIEALPTTYIFNKEGNLIFSEVGYRQWDDPAVIEMVENLIVE